MTRSTLILIAVGVGFLSLLGVRYFARCDAGDPQVARGDPALRRAQAAAVCYVKGSRLIVMRPQPDGGERIVRERAEALKRAAAWSEAFWTGGRR